MNAPSTPASAFAPQSVKREARGPSPRSRDRWRPLIVLAALLLVAFGCARSGERCRFDVPAGRADATLMQFARQAGVEIVYDVDAVGKARTNAVLGEYSPSEALLRMLDGTGLIVERDLNTGAFAVINALRESTVPSASSGHHRPQGNRGEAGLSNSSGV